MQLLLKPNCIYIWPLVNMMVRLLSLLLSIGLISCNWFGNMAKDKSYQLPIDSVSFLNSFNSPKSFESLDKINFTYQQKVYKEKNDSIPIIIKEMGATSNDLNPNVLINPLFDLLKPHLTIKNNYYTPEESVFVGFAYENDTSKIDSMLRLDENQKFFPFMIQQLIWTKIYYDTEALALILCRNEFKRLGKNGITIDSLIARPKNISQELKDVGYQDLTMDITANVILDLNKFNYLPEIGVVKVYSNNQIFYAEVNTKVEKQSLTFLKNVPPNEFNQ